MGVRAPPSLAADVHGVPATHPGVTQSGQSGDLAGVKKLHGLDRDSIVGAALDLIH